MIPKVRTWLVRLPATVISSEKRIEVYGPTKLLARLAFRQDYPQYWMREIKISLARSKG